jgi:hypothetical protein
MTLTYSLAQARVSAKRINETHLEGLSEKVRTPTSQLKFISDAWSEVVQCRRVLKWTYAYGFYSFEDDHVPEVQRKKTFFEFLQARGWRVGGWGQASYNQWVRFCTHTLLKFTVFVATKLPRTLGEPCKNSPHHQTTVVNKLQKEFLENLC